MVYGRQKPKNIYLKMQNQYNCKYYCFKDKFKIAWNEFLFALMFTRSNVRTLPVVLTELIGGYGIQWGELSALSLIAIIPGVILVIFFQKYLVRVLTFGAVKG